MPTISLIGLVRPPPEPPPSNSVTHFVADHRLLYTTGIVKILFSGGALLIMAFRFRLSLDWCMKGVFSYQVLIYATMINMHWLYVVEAHSDPSIDDGGA